MCVQVRVEFVPVGTIGRPGDRQPKRVAVPEQAAPSDDGEKAGSGRIEIELSSGARVRVDAFVNEKALARVLRALKGSA